MLYSYIIDLKLASQHPSQDPKLIGVPVKIVCEAMDGPDSVGHQNKTRVTSMDIPILDPHDIQHYVHSDLDLTVESESVRSYWRRAAESDVGWAKNQPDHGIIPVGIYADETKYGTRESQEKILCPSLGSYLTFLIFLCTQISSIVFSSINHSSSVAKTRLLGSSSCEELPRVF